MIVGLLTAALASTVSGCSSTSPDEHIPAGLIRLAERQAEPFSRLVEKFEFRWGRLYGNREARQELLGVLEPGDVIAVSNRGTLAANLIPGFFTHSAAYVGTEAQLRALGIWDDPALAPHHAAIRDGRIIIEAVNDGVTLSKPEKVLDTDRVLAARPGGPAGTAIRERRRSVIALLERFGTPFDFHFDASTPEKLFCVELLQQSIPALRLPVEEVYGRPTIKPVSIAESLFRPGSDVAFLLYIKGSRDGFQSVSKEDLRRELAEAREKARERCNCGDAAEAATAIGTSAPPS